MKRINLPVSREEIDKLKVGDEVLISGTMVTARDAAHKYLVENPASEMQELLKGTFIYHCGPVVARDGDKWRFVAAGPTTSMREEPYEAEVMHKFGVRGVIGKGGMGEKTLSALHEYGAVYFDAIGGLAVILARSVVRVKEVFKLEEFGTPEAMWVIEVKDFPAVVTMDSTGGSLNAVVREKSEKAMKELVAKKK